MKCFLNKIKLIKMKLLDYIRRIFKRNNDNPESDVQYENIKKVKTEIKYNPYNVENRFNSGNKQVEKHSYLTTPF